MNFIAFHPSLLHLAEMASHYKKSGSPFYYIRYRRADGTWSDKSSGVRVSHKGGLRKVRAMVAEYNVNEQEYADDCYGSLFSQWVDSWINYQYTNKNSNWRYRNCWRHLQDYFKIHRIIHPNEVTYQLCHAYMRWRTDPDICEREGRKPCAWNTALTEIRTLGAIEQEAVRRGYIVVNPCCRLRLGRRNTKQKREIRADELEKIAALLEDAPEWMQDCWLVAIKQGCRLTEVQVDMNDVDEDALLITFHTKGGKTHTAPLHRDLLPLVAKARERRSKRLLKLPGNASVKWVKWFRKHGFDGLSFHCTRVTVVTRLARAGYSEAQTMEYVGHCSEMVHAVYRKLQPADLRHLGDAL